MSKNLNVLFLCVENAGRSQIAEAFFKKYASKKYSAISAGTLPSSQLNPLVVKVMNEIGIDLSEQTPKLLSADMMEHSLKTVNMGCMDDQSCPALSFDAIIDWNISDPKEKSLDEIREIRDQIKSKVMKLITSLEKDD